MPWFSRKKKRKNKKTVVNSSKDDAVVMTTSQPLFYVVVQDYESSVSDQLSVERGQVIESLFSQENWIYIRNVDGQCGYIPSSFCFPLEKLRMGLPDDKNRQLRIHPRPTTIHVDTFECPTGGEGGGEGIVEGGGVEEEGVVNSPDSGISCSQQASSSNMESVQSFHNTTERSTTRNNTADLVQPRSHQQALGTSRGHTHSVRNSDRRKRFFHPPLPLLETVAPAASGDASKQGTMDHSEATHSPSPSPPPLQPVNLADSRQKREVTNTAPVSQLSVARAAAVNAERDEQRSNRSSSDGDDVFLPEAKKPVGIYQSAETYKPKFEGEMPLQRDEIVVVLEVGRGEWVWALGSEHREGLVPKSLLHKYRPDIPEEEAEEIEERAEEGVCEDREEDLGEVIDLGEAILNEGRREAAAPGASSSATATSATQTELIIDGVVHEINCSLPPRCTVTDTNTQPSLLQDTATVAIQTEFTSPNWFKNNTPATTPNHTLPRSTTTGTTPHPHPKHSLNTASQSHPPAASPLSCKLLCSPRSSQTHSSATSSAASNCAHLKPQSAQTTETASATVFRARTPSGHYLPLTPASTLQKTSVREQTPSSKGAPILHDMSATVVPAENESEACGTTPSQVAQQQLGENTSGRPPSSGQGDPSSSDAAVNKGTGTLQRHRQALRQHTRIISSIPFEPDNEAATGSAQSRAASRRRIQPTPIVTAVRDYVPPRQARNALALRRGDVMYAQTHVPYPHGWVWVYHTLLKKYGYIPKDYIAYMYLVQKDKATVLEDVV